MSYAPFTFRFGEESRLFAAPTAVAAMGLANDYFRSEGYDVSGGAWMEGCAPGHYYWATGNFPD